MRARRRGGFTLVELVIVVAVIGLLAAVTFPAMSGWGENQRARAAARSMSDLLAMARAESIRTRTSHLVFFQTDSGGAPLLNSSGEPVAALLARDDDDDGAPDAGELVSVVPFDPSGSLNWGFALASEAAPGDPRGVVGNPPAASWTFVEPDGDPANWVVYQPDGAPRPFTTNGGYTTGSIGSGAGVIYVTNGERDYAVVLSPLGGVRVHSWDLALNQWRQ